MVPANREQRQGQLADLGEERLVVFAILCERCELAAEGVVNRTCARIEFSVMVARLLVDRRWISRQIVIETVEQDALATRDQPLDIWAAEVEVPDLGICQLRVPSSKPGKRGVHRDPL